MWRKYSDPAKTIRLESSGSCEIRCGIWWNCISTSCENEKPENRNFPRNSPQTFPFHSTSFPDIHRKNFSPLFQKHSTMDMCKKISCISIQNAHFHFSGTPTTTTISLFVCILCFRSFAACEKSGFPAVRVLRTVLNCVSQEDNSGFAANQVRYTKRRMIKLC